MIGGATWKRWYGLMRDELVRTAKREGDLSYWNGDVGPVYCTAVHTPPSWPCRGTTSLSASARSLSALDCHSPSSHSPGFFTCARASIEPFGGDPVPGKIELDSGGMIFRPEQGPAVKVDFSNCYRITFDAPAPEVCVPGVMLTDGSRLPGPYTALTDAAVKFPKRNNLSIPSTEIAWIIYQRFPAALAANAPAGETGALLPGGDFFSGTVRGADAEAVKVFNDIFGPRRLDARKGEVFAAALRPARPLTVQYEFRTADGGLFGADRFRRRAFRHAHAPEPALRCCLKLPDGGRSSRDPRRSLNRCRPLSLIPQWHGEPATGLRVAPEGGLITETKAVITCPVPAGFTEFVARGRTWVRMWP